MRKLIVYFFIFISIFAKENIILVENENSFFFYMKNGKAKGLYPMIIEDINKQKNLNLKVKALESDEILNLKDMKNSIMDLIESQERSKYYYFIPTFFYGTANIYFKGDAKNHLMSFYKKRLGIIKGSYIEKRFIEEYGFLENQLIDIKNRENGLKLLKKGSIDAIVTDNQYGFKEPLNSYSLPYIEPMQTSLAIPKTQKRLYLSLKKYFDNLSDEKLKKFIDKARVEYFKSKFKDRYKNLKGKEIDVIFPRDVSLYPLYYNINGEKKGVTIDYLNNISEIIGVKFNKKFETNEKFKPTDVEALGVVKKEDFIYTNSYYTLTPAIYNRKKEGFINNILEARDGKFVITKNSYILPYVEKYIDEKNIIIVDTLENAMNKIILREADYGITDYKTITNKLYRSKYEKNLKVAGVLNNIKYEVSFGIGKENKELAEAMLDISSSFFNQNMSRNLYTKENLDEFEIYNFLIFISITLLVSFLVLWYRFNRSKKEKLKYEKVMYSLIEALETVNLVNDNETGSHIKRVNRYAQFLSEKLGKNKEFCEEIGKFASLHDIGKVGISRDILKKPGKLTDDEFEKMKLHTVIGHDIIKKANISEMANNIVYYHHEKWNGKGYPCNLKGEEIPIEARIVSVVDVYDALRQKRVYKEAMSHEEAIEIISSEKGKSFDPNIVEIFLIWNEKFEEMFDKNRE